MTNIKIFAGVGGQEFTEYILRNPSTLIYSQPRFLALVTEHLDAHCSWLVARKENQITGLLPFLVKEGPLGPVFNSLAYYGSNGGVIQAVNDIETKVVLVDAFYSLASDSGAVAATLITNPLEGDSELYDSCVRHDFRDERIGQITHLPENIHQLLATFDDPRPRNIRRAIKEGVKVSKDRAAGLEFLFNTHVENMAAIGGLVKKQEFFEAIPLKMRSGDWEIFTASLNGKPIAALLLFYFNQTVEYFTPVIIESHRNTQALALIIYEAMSDAIERQYKNWNWGGTWLSQGGVYDFKRRWGTTEYRYYYYTRIFNRDLFQHTPSYVQNHYPGFYLIPFEQLE